MKCMNIAGSSSTSAGGAITRSQVWNLFNLAWCQINQHHIQVQPEPGEPSTRSQIRRTIFQGTRIISIIRKLVILLLRQMRADTEEETGWD